MLRRLTDCDTMELVGTILGAAAGDIEPLAEPQSQLPLQAGQVIRVLKFSERWAASADPSLVRHLIFTLLAACAPPYSSDFAASLLRCESHAISQKAARMHVTKRRYQSIMRLSGEAKRSTFARDHKTWKFWNGALMHMPGTP